MRVGANYPWYGNQMGLWFGPTRDDIPPAESAHAQTGDQQMRADWTETFPMTISRLKAAGISMLRVWLLGNAWNYGTGGHERAWLPPPPPPEGDSWTRSYASHLDELLGFCRNAGLKVILVLVAHGAFFPTEREALAVDPTIREDFFVRVFEPMLTVSDGYRDIVYAWEPVNEPNWPTQYLLSRALAPDYWPTRPNTPVVPLADMQAFLDGATVRILAHGHRVTHGFSFGPGCRYELPFPLGALLPLVNPLLALAHPLNVSDEQLFQVTAPASSYRRQFHYYPTVVEVNGSDRFNIRNRLPSYASSREAFLGEISSSLPDPTQAMHEPAFAAWERLRGLDTTSVNDTVFYRLALAEQLGYQLCFLWTNSEEWKGAREPILTDEALEGVRRFLRESSLPRL